VRIGPASLMLLLRSLNSCELIPVLYVIGVQMLPPQPKEYVLVRMRKGPGNRIDLFAFPLLSPVAEIMMMRG
jgi:hypothetical protein